MKSVISIIPLSHIYVQQIIFQIPPDFCVKTQLIVIVHPSFFWSSGLLNIVHGLVCSCLSRVWRPEKEDPFKDGNFLNSYIVIKFSGLGFLRITAPFLFQHWIRLEMQADVLVHHLQMVVDPSDSSYTPSLVVVSGGPSPTSMKELQTVGVAHNTDTITLLSEQTEVFFWFLLSY